MYYTQYIATACVGLAVASTSVHVLWPSSSIPHIISGNSPLEKDITNEEVSWIVMSLFVGTIPGAMISGWMLEKIGRKNSLVLLTAPLFLLWLPIGFTSSVWLLYVERFAAGLAISALIIIVTLYNAEIADKNIRGRLGTTLNGFSLFGELLVACTGPFVSYFELSLINCALPLIATVLIYFMPESPYYLVKIGKKREAEQNLKRLASNYEVDIKTAMKNIETTVEIDLKNGSSMWGFLTEPLYRKSLVIIFGIKLLQQLSGSSAFGEYTDKIIASNHTNISREAWEIILNAIPLVGVLLCGVLVDKIGRKILLIISLIGCAVTLITEGVCCMMQEHFESDIDHLSWLATGSLLAYSLLRPLGIGTLPYVLMGELFATNIKHHAVAFCGTANAITGFIMIKYFGQVADVNALFVTFWIFAVICIFGSIFVHFLIPETSCKTFTEIQEDLHKTTRTAFSQVELT